ncbi:hypothetical protein H2O73_15290 [Vibrio sp. 404]|uniref:Lipoprotein n=1 Tax=Vibrio marinisediminis TaxID=2758441 RepID=A0A7W2FT23_9VIBR|nr:hypothetical protein [Vibrio marinisediminis]MBA5763727.1 hypothetical protein [Vibrio marinisediminis]
MKQAIIQKLLVLLASSLTLFGCGGGGGGGGGSTNSAPAAKMSVQDLNISAENSLESVYQVNIDVDISARSTAKAYISVCDNADAQGDLSQLDFDECLLKGSLDEGRGEFELRVPNHTEELIAVIWIMENDQDPLVYTLSHNNQKERYWLIN